VKRLASLLTLSALFAVAGCNTIEGLGQDIQRGGQVIEDAMKKK